MSKFRKKNSFVLSMEGIKLFIHKQLVALADKMLFLEDNFLWSCIKPYYKMYFNPRNYPFNIVNEQCIHFYSLNTNRVNAVANLLADDKSKKIYHGIIKFRQTNSKKDFPFHIPKESQYFLKELKLSKHEIFLDCGAFGNTIGKFLRRCKKFKQIIAFEPDPNGFEKLKKKYGNIPQITLLNVGVYNKDGDVLFAGGMGGASMITTDNEQANITGSIQVRAIDGFGLEKVTFIKMDIEGAELKALKGAEKTILRDKPKLAISIYHSDEDMISIVEYIHNLVPEYKLYVRHYDGSLLETILYAIIPR